VQDRHISNVVFVHFLQALRNPELRRLGSLSDESGSPGKEIVQVGILVKDVAEAAKKLEKLIGIGPFEILEPEYRDLTYRHKTGKFKIRIALAKAGPIQIELMQPLHGETIYDEFAQRKGHGLHHLGIKTDNIEQSVKEMQEKGFQVIQSGNRPGVKWSYLSTEDQTDVIFELLEKKQTSSS